MNKKRDFIAGLVAEIRGCSTNLVQKVRRGERENEDILTTTMDVHEGVNKLVENLKHRVSLEKGREKRVKTTLGDLRKTENNAEKGGQMHLLNDLNN